MTRSCVQVLHHSQITAFGFVGCQVLDVNSVLMSLHHVALSYAANVSEVHAASIFRTAVCRLMSRACYKILFQKGAGTEGTELGLVSHGVKKVC
jgi:hypothetical protein